MHCPECGANLPEDALYCGICGKRLDDDDPVLLPRSTMIGGPPTGLTGPLPLLTEEELALLLRGEGDASATGKKTEPAGDPADQGQMPDFGESAEVGRGEEFGRKAVSFEGIYPESEEDGFSEEEPEGQEPRTKKLSKRDLTGNGGFLPEYVPVGEAPLPDPYEPDTEELDTEPLPPQGRAPAGFGGEGTFAGNGAEPAGSGGWKHTLLIAFLAVAATVALVLWTVRSLTGGGGEKSPVSVTPTIAESRGTQSEASVAPKTESTESKDSSRTESAISDVSRAESTASGDSAAESDSSDESHSGRRRVTATPTPTLLPTMSPTPRPTATPTPKPKTDVDFIRQALGNKNAVLLYVSDAGSAWHTELTLRNDATFTGNYEESIVEIAGDHEMIVRNCTFTGHVYECKKLKNGTYSMKIKVRMNGSEGESHLEGKKRYVTAQPKGLASDDEIILYPPGTSTEGLPEGLLGWLRRARGSEITNAQLPCYCILDLNSGFGFGEYQ